MHGGNNDYKRFSFLHVGSFFRRGKRLNGENKIDGERESGHLGGHLAGGVDGRKGRGRCRSCDNIRVKPRKQFIDCIVD